jgi:hypothetical protein
MDQRVKLDWRKGVKQRERKGEVLTYSHWSCPECCVLDNEKQIVLHSLYLLYFLADQPSNSCLHNVDIWFSWCSKKEYHCVGYILASICKLDTFQFCSVQGFLNHIRAKK